MNVTSISIPFPRSLLTLAEPTEGPQPDMGVGGKAEMKPSVNVSFFARLKRALLGGCVRRFLLSG